MRQKNEKNREFIRSLNKKIISSLCNMFSLSLNSMLFIILGIFVLAIALLVVYIESKSREQNHKIGSMLSLVSSLAEELNSIKFQRGGGVGRTNDEQNSLVTMLRMMTRMRMGTRMGMATRMGTRMGTRAPEIVTTTNP